MDDVLLFAAIGFAAQLIDGAIGMAYGVTSTTALLSFGVSPAVASASVHAAEMFTTGVSGAAHWRLGNVDARIFRRLVIPGMIGGAVGAYVLSALPGDTIRPFVSAYLFVMGGVILYKAVRRVHVHQVPPNRFVPLGLVGAALDAIGGGGWGPMVTSTMVSWGVPARMAVGTSNAVEFFVTTVISGTFLLTIGFELWSIILGLVLGGCLAAPFAAYVTRRLPDKPLMILVGVTIMLLSLRDILRAFTG
ncbi:MAG: sulfite exporter TauE/SafE family protein [Rhodospirillaceae bacterium]|nr:sulfite exporter TauE/SafE family protein [Rhodospirillaceae bacterium]